ncbi:hypothetical protein D3C81_1776120 [compost metagenome]
MGDDTTVYVGTKTAADLAGLLQGQNRVVGEVAAHAAVLFRDAQQQHAALARLGPDLTIDVMLLGPALFIGDQFLGDEAAHGFLEDRQIVDDPRGLVGSHGIPQVRRQSGKFLGEARPA